jgi:hypothetical protein
VVTVRSAVAGVEPVAPYEREEADASKNSVYTVVHCGIIYLTSKISSRDSLLLASGRLWMIEYCD